MDYDLDLLKGEARYRSPKFMSVWNWFDATDLPKAWGWELAVLVATPGFAFDHLCVAFQWVPKVRLDVVPEIVRYFANSEFDVEAAALQNFHSITLDDGVDFLHAIIAMRPKYAASVPLCVTQSLRQLRANGLSLDEVAAKFGITKRQAGNFWMENRFDPFTGLDLRHA